MSDAPAVEWSGNSGIRSHCQVCTEYVVDAWHHDGVHYLLTATRSSPTRNRVQAWSSLGEFIWRSEWLNGDCEPFEVDCFDGGSQGRVASDGSSVWALCGGGTYSILYRLDALDGDLLFEEDGSRAFEVYNLLPDYSGSVWLAHDYVPNTDGNGTGFVSLWNDDTWSERYGGTTGSAYSISMSGTTAYIGHSLQSTDDFELAGSCESSGVISRYDDKVLKWITLGRITEDRPIEGGGGPFFPGTTGQGQTLVGVQGDNVYFAFKGGSIYGAVTTAEGTPTFLQELNECQLITESGGCAGRNTPIKDFDVDSASIWIVVNRSLYQIQLDGTVITTVPYVVSGETVATVDECDPSQAFCVAADQSGYALVGGLPVPCEVGENEPQESSDVTCEAECDPSTAEWDWCRINTCGTVSTNGRLPVDDCTYEQWPPCTGPFHIEYTCGATSVTEDFDVTGVRTCGESGDYAVWSGAGGGVSMQFTANCDGEDELILGISGCTDVVVTNLQKQCDGPNGYASWSFDFTADCGSCTATGCGGVFRTDCVIQDCTECPDGAPAEYTADMSGFGQGAGSCATCSNVGDVSLAFVGNTMGDCTWEGELTFCSEVLTVRLKMWSGTVTIDVLNAGGFLQATYTADDDPFSCLAGGAFTRTYLSYSGTECTVWPTSISVSAA